MPLLWMEIIVCFVGPLFTSLLYDASFPYRKPIFL